LLVGYPDKEIHQVLISLDCTEEVVEEAVRTGCDLIVSHHPIIFKGLRRLNGANYVERVVIKAIKHDIAFYAMHTNLDTVVGGVHRKIAERIGLQDTRILHPKGGLLNKLAVYVPVSHAEQVRAALFSAGAGHIGN